MDWLSPQFPDFLAKCKTAICVDLRSSLSSLHSFSSTLHHLTAAWAEVAGLDIFTDEGESTLEGLQARHRQDIHKMLLHVGLVQWPAHECVSDYSCIM